MDAGTFEGFSTALEEPGILAVMFDRPETMNASTIGMKRDLVELLTRAQMDDAVRVLVFTGTGRAFWAGDDMKSYTAGTAGSMMGPIGAGHHTPLGTYDALRAVSQAVNVAVRNLDKLTVAAINGFAIQTGFSFALACDFRVAARSARMGSATLRFALLPDEGGHWLLVQHLGVARTIDFLMRKRIVSADEALELGLVHQVTTDDELAGAAMDLARELAEGPQVAMRLLKRSIYSAAELAFPHALDDIASKTAISDHHADAEAGARSFRDKRPGRFNEWLEPT
jgi:2-(1,2-epoxy-1,2-dihydrophenyl)acetyl-CoA isomerase